MEGPCPPYKALRERLALCLPAGVGGTGRKWFRFKQEEELAWCFFPYQLAEDTEKRENNLWLDKTYMYGLSYNPRSYLECLIVGSVVSREQFGGHFLLDFFCIFCHL